MRWSRPKEGAAAPGLGPTAHANIESDTFPESASLSSPHLPTRHPHQIQKETLEFHVCLSPYNGSICLLFAYFFMVPWAPPLLQKCGVDLGKNAECVGKAKGNCEKNFTQRERQLREELAGERGEETRQREETPPPALGRRLFYNARRHWGDLWGRPPRPTALRAWATHTLLLY